MKIKHTKVRISSTPFEYTNSEEAAPEKLAYANKVGLGKIVKKSATRHTIKGKKKTILKKA